MSKKIFWLLMLLLLPTIHGINKVHAEAISAAPQVSPPKPFQFRSAKTCKVCHATIYKEWASSWMAKAYTNGVFQTDFMRWKAYAEAKGLEPKQCLRCHAPVALLTGDLAIGAEGVTCEICHRTAKVRERHGRHYLVMDPRNIQYGTSKNLQTSSHAVGSSDALRSSQLCAGCHLDIQEGDIPLERTYQEWLDSPYSQQEIHCRDCHMKIVPGAATVESNQTPPANATHASHLFPGGHSNSSLLKNAATLKLKHFVQEQQIKIYVTNAKVGHNFPTGGAHPAELILKLSANDKNGDAIFTEQRLYKMWFLNSAGKPASQLEASKSIRDTTLKPLETRTEIFKLTKPFHEVKVSLIYYLLPSEIAKTYDRLALGSDYKPVVIAHCLLTAERMVTCE